MEKLLKRGKARGNLELLDEERREMNGALRETKNTRNILSQITETNKENGKIIIMSDQTRRKERQIL